MRRWLRVVDNNKLTDTMLMDQLCRIAYGSRDPTYRNLGALAERYCEIFIDKEDPYRMRFGETIGNDWRTFPAEAWQYAAKDAIVTRLVFTELRDRSRKLVRQHRIPKETLDEFGPLTIRVQIRAAIALRQIELNGIHIDETIRDASYLDLKDQVKNYVGELCSCDAFSDVFKRDKEGNLLLTEGGTPRKHMGPLRELLMRVADEHSITLKMTPSGHVSTARSFWEQYADAEPFIFAWIEVDKVSKLLQFFGKLQASRIHPGYSTLVRTGRTSSKKPNLQQIPSKGSFRHMFVPRSGHVFVIADYSTIELRTLAAHCENVIGYSVMADQIRAGRDLHAYTASLLAGGDFDDFDDFVALKTDDPGYYKEKRHAAKALNFGFPGGLGAETFIKFAKLNYGITVSKHEAESFRDKFLNEIYPEIGEYMHSDSALILAHNLGCKPREVRKHFKTAGQIGACKRIVQGSPFKRDGEAYGEKFVDRCWDSLAELVQFKQLEYDIDGRNSGEWLERRLFFSHVVAPAGFIRGQTTFCQTKNTPFQSAAATGGKIAAWDLFRAGYRVRGYIHDEFIVEIREDSNFEEHTRNIDRIMCDAMRKVTGTVPVETEYAVASCWSKSAELVRDDAGNIQIWRPERQSTPARAKAS